MPGKSKIDGRKRVIPQNTIRAWRIHRRLTVQKLAEKAGLSIATVSNAANRKSDVSGKTLVDLARALETTPGALLDVLPSEAWVMWWDTWKALGKKERRILEDTAKSLRENA